MFEGKHPDQRAQHPAHRVPSSGDHPQPRAEAGPGHHFAHQPDDRQDRALGCADGARSGDVVRLDRDDHAAWREVGITGQSLDGSRRWPADIAAHHPVTRGAQSGPESDRSADHQPAARRPADGRGQPAALPVCFQDGAVGAIVTDSPHRPVPDLGHVRTPSSVFSRRACKWCTRPGTTSNPFESAGFRPHQLPASNTTFARHRTGVKRKHPA
jgi:hypothetical protein